MPRYLTKSRFLLGLDCPAKLYYTGKEIYPDKNVDNEFLEALARGGYQVGALAKCYYPGGNEITTLDPVEAVSQTQELLLQENVVIFEAAFQVGHYFIRVDILEKIGNRLNLVEVKSKSFGGNSSLDMLNSGGYIHRDWLAYVYDVAFQKHVLQLAEPGREVFTYLMLADKNKTTTVSGLNQSFLLREYENGRTYVEDVGDVTPATLGEEILSRVNVDDLCEKIYSGVQSREGLPMPFEDYCQYLAGQYWNDLRIQVPVHAKCGSCEFRATQEEEQEGKLSGFRECWSQQLGWADRDFEKPLVFEIWDHRNKKVLIEEGIYHLDQVRPHHIGDDAEDMQTPLLRQARQWLQVRRTVNNVPEPYIDHEGLRREMDSWVYPLHMIDFETSTVAIPFYAGMRPYETVAFQFSHHLIHEDGRIEHRGQYLNVERGTFPNFEFVRRLRDELVQDEGSVFRYAHHENTVLNQVRAQLMENREPDRQELVEFIDTLTHVKKGRRGHRDMIDLLELVKLYYWHPLMGGSNSLKAVLPAILSSSEPIQQKYSQPIYGSHGGIPSLNYENWQWIRRDAEGNIISPYKLLPSLFDDLDEENVEEFLMGDRLADGGAAMTAYSLMQFTEMPEGERERIIRGLLKYCELDTMAMVFLWEALKCS